MNELAKRVYIARLTYLITTSTAVAIISGKICTFIIARLLWSDTFAFPIIAGAGRALYLR